MNDTNKNEKLDGVHRKALAQYDDIQTAQSVQRAQMRSDRRFATVPGAQYEGAWGDMYENRPKPEINKIQLAITRLYNEYRSNRMEARFVRKDGAKDGGLADTCAGLFRADEMDSVAQEAYDNSFDEAVTGGFGAYRVLNVDVDDTGETDYQRIRFTPIFDADQSVYFDLNAKSQSKAEALYCFVVYPITAKLAKAQYGIDPASWPTTKLSVGAEFDWCAVDIVYLAEYYEVEYEKDTLLIYTMLDGTKERHKESDMTAEHKEFLEVTRDKTTPIVAKKIKVKRVHKYLMSGDRILEDYGYIAGPNIPIVPVYGKRFVIDGVEHCYGETRYARDAQSLLNMQVSALTEIAATSASETPVFTTSQIAGHENQWSQRNIDRPAFLTVNPTFDTAGNEIPVQQVPYTHAPQIPPALVALLQTSQGDLREILGDAQSAEKLASNVSAQAIQLTQTRIDAKAYIYMDNMAKGIARGAAIWLGMAKEVYTDDDRVMKTVDDLEEVSSVNLSELVIRDGRAVKQIDWDDAAYDVQIDIGPASQSRRQKTVQDLTALMGVTADPQAQNVLMSMVMLNLEGEGLDQLKAYNRRNLINAGAIKPNEEEAAEMAKAANQAEKPDPQAAYLMAQAEKATADAALAQAKAQEIAQGATPETAMVKAQIEAAKYQAEVEKAAIEAQTAKEAQAFDREKMQIELEREMLKLAGEKQKYEHELQVEAVRGQASIDVAQAGKEGGLESVNAQIEALAQKMAGNSAQPIVIQSGGKSFTINRTPNGYRGQITE